MESIDNILKKLEELEAENRSLHEWQDSVNQLLNQMLEMLTGLNESASEVANIKTELSNLTTYASINRYRINSLPYELADPDYTPFFFKPHILSKKETLSKIIDEKKSFSRFGDGEFAAIIGNKRWNFQDISQTLSDKLQKVLTCDDERIMIGLNPTFYRNLFDIPENDADGVRAYMQPQIRRLHAQLLSSEKIYGNALFHNISSEEDISDLKKIWDDRDIVIIEGVHTGMGVGNDLLDNCRSAGRILAPAENAVDKYDMIMEEACKQSVDKLFLLALGPTATALSYDLCLNGYQAIDIGHIDLIYEAYLRKLPNLYSVRIPYKYCSRDEKVSGRAIPEIDDPTYRSQIIKVI